jgi:hypothetical protein
MPSAYLRLGSAERLHSRLDLTPPKASGSQVPARVGIAWNATRRDRPAWFVGLAVLGSNLLGEGVAGEATLPVSGRASVRVLTHYGRGFDKTLSGVAVGGRYTLGAQVPDASAPRSGTNRRATTRQREPLWREPPRCRPRRTVADDARAAIRLRNAGDSRPPSAVPSVTGSPCPLRGLRAAARRVRGRPAASAPGSRAARRGRARCRRRRWAPRAPGAALAVGTRRWGRSGSRRTAGADLMSGQTRYRAASPIPRAARWRGRSAPRARPARARPRWPRRAWPR